MVERVLCKHEVVGSIPSGSTTRAIAESIKFPLQVASIEAAVAVQ